MKRVRCVIAVVIAGAVLLGGCMRPSTAANGTDRQAAPQTEKRPLYVPGSLLVEFRAGTPTARINEILQDVPVQQTRQLGNPMIYEIKLAPETPMDEVIKRLRSSPEIKHVERNQMIFLDPE